MRRPFRIGLVAVGLAGAAYGAASLSGGWLGTPPWWERSAPLTVAEWSRRYCEAEYERWNRDGPALPTTRSPVQDFILANFGTATQLDDPWNLARLEAPRHVEPRPGHGWISRAVATLGLGLVAIGARPPGRRPEPGALGS